MSTAVTDLSLTSLLPAWALAGAIVLTSLLALFSFLHADKRLRLGLCAVLAVELLVAGLGAATGTLQLSPRRVQLARHLAVQSSIETVQAEIATLETQIAALEKEQAVYARALHVEKQQLESIAARRAQFTIKLGDAREELDKRTKHLRDLSTVIDRMAAAN